MARSLTRPALNLTRVAILWLIVQGSVSAQPGRADAVDPIRCWWRTSAGAVATGEPLDATLTCAVRDDGALQVVADETRLGAAVVQLAPFEVLGGSHPADLRTSTHRFFQYHYTVRVIDRDLIGHDATFPDIRVSYRVQSRGAAESVEGRERTYVVPGRPVRILSIVPLEADDIRDAAGEPFADVESLRFRAQALRLVALALAMLGALVIVPAVWGLVRRAPHTAPEDADRLPARDVLSAAIGEMEAVQVASRAGWTTDLAARAAAAVRLLAACRLDRRVSQHALASGAAAPAGRLAVERGLVKRSAVSVSSAVTAADLRTALEQLPLTTPADVRQGIEDLQGALSRLTRANYVAEPVLDDPGLDEAMTGALAAARDLKRTYAWPRRVWTSIVGGRRGTGARP